MVKLSSRMVSAPACEDCFDLLRAIHFYFDMRGVREPGAHGLQSFRDIAYAIGGEHRKMIVFDHDCIGKRIAMIVTAATADRITFDKAEARRGLAACRRCAPAFLQRRPHTAR